MIARECDRSATLPRDVQTFRRKGTTGLTKAVTYAYDGHYDVWATRW